MAKGTRKDSKGTRKGSKGRKGLRLFQRVWSPLSHILLATGESAQRVGSTAGRIVKEAVGLPAGVGRTFTKHGNMAAQNVFSGGRSRKGRSGRR